MILKNAHSVEGKQNIIIILMALSGYNVKNVALVVVLREFQVMQTQKIHGTAEQGNQGKQYCDDGQEMSYEEGGV